MGLDPLLRNFGGAGLPPSSTGLAPQRARAGQQVAAAGRAVSLKNRQSGTLISPSETKRFAGHGVSHWNPYERRINHFAGLFVFKGLTPLSLRSFHGLFVFNALAPLLLSPRNAHALPSEGLRGCDSTFFIALLFGL
jgi:hypothetical protein